MFGGDVPHVLLPRGGINRAEDGNSLCMSTSPLRRQPLATAIAGALLVLGSTGTVWATSSVGSHHQQPPEQTSSRTR
jgi:hypothetical protein